jgi:hypothetical protein
MAGRILWKDTGAGGEASRILSDRLSLTDEDKDISIVTGLVEGRVEERRGLGLLVEFLERSRVCLLIAVNPRRPDLPRKKQLRTKSSGHSCRCERSDRLVPDPLECSFLALCLFVTIPNTLVKTCGKGS